MNVDKLAAAGEGSTGATCAIVRTHYSTWDGTALAYESFRHWQDWPAYLEVEDERGPARLIETGMVIILSAQRSFEKELGFHDQLGIPYEEWDVATLQAKLPFCDATAFYPPRRPDDEHFGDPTAESVPGAIFIPSAGYVNDPQLASHNLQRRRSQRGEVSVRHRSGRHPAARWTSRWSDVEERRRDSCPRGGQRRWPPFVHRQPHGRDRRHHESHHQGTAA